MGKVILSIAMSLDGFAAGANVSNKLPMGENGEHLHDWMFHNKTEADKMVINELMNESGAVIAGRHTYDLGIDAWGGSSPFSVPAIIISHRAPGKMTAGFIFEKSIESGLKKAREIAGDKNTWVMGGANIAQQFIKAKLINEIQINLAPILLGKGSRLFEDNTELINLERTRIIETPGATHISYKIK